MHLNTSVIPEGHCTMIYIFFSKMSLKYIYFGKAINCDMMAIFSREIWGSNFIVFFKLPKF